MKITYSDLVTGRRDQCLVEICSINRWPAPSGKFSWTLAGEAIPLEFELHDIYIALGVFEHLHAIGTGDREAMTDLAEQEHGYSLYCTEFLDGINIFAKPVKDGFIATCIEQNNLNKIVGFVSREVSLLIANDISQLFDLMMKEEFIEGKI